MAEKYAITEPRPDTAHEALTETVRLSELYLHKSYLNGLSRAQVVPAGRDVTRIEPGTNLKLIELEAILIGKNDSLANKLRDLLGAVEAFDAGLVLVVNGKGDRISMSIGVCADSLSSLTPAYNTLLSSLSGILPGCRYRQLRASGVRALLDDVFPAMPGAEGPESHAIASVSAFPVVRGSRDTGGRQDVARLDTLIDGMRGKPFTMVLLSKSVNSTQLSLVQQQLEALYTQLSPFEKVSLTMNESDTDNVNLNFSHAVNANESYSTGLTHGVSHTTGTNRSESHVEYDEEAAKKQAGLGILSAAVALGVTAISSKGFSEINPAQALFYGSGINTLLNNAGTMAGLDMKAHDKNITEGSHEDFSTSDSKQITFSTSGGTSDSQGYTIGNSKTQGTSNQITTTNKFISGLLGEIDSELEQLRRLKREGAFSSAAYFIAGDVETAVTAANLYRAMTQSGGSMEIRSPINCWEDRDALAEMTQYLCRGRHPVFELPETLSPTAEAAQLIGIEDAPSYFALPERSVPGYIVSEYAGFNRDIISQSPMSSGKAGNGVEIGCIYHMGRTETQTPVSLDVNDLTKHLFVCGATGVGKSNFCYQLLDKLIDAGVLALVIEPAKGEYASVLGGRTGGDGKPLFHVFGVDPRRTPLLKINPFAFPEGVSVIQHIERLLDIFNAAWPMYSAMPAILKEAIEKIYSDRGFEFICGERPEGARFPCFDDLLEALPKIIRQSAYSSEVQGNYIGALVTRVRSLTNGVYGLIFGGDEVGDSTLFDDNSIVDISRIGSSETKALIMGVLTMRLNEYRMCSGRVNSPLCHVTLLEEAHNLLRASNPGSAEGVNVRAASVEMITNAIAEMRTYGEGFIIADQSPSVLDPSVIRNTQTKAAFMLPDKLDRNVVGKAMSLSDDQMQELARLSPGVAAVYQNGWTGAVLSKIDYFPPEKAAPFVYSGPSLPQNTRALISQALSVTLSGHTGSGSGVDREKIASLLKSDFTLAGSRYIRAAEILRRYMADGVGPDTSDKTQLVSTLVPLREIITAACTAAGRDVRRWSRRVRESLSAHADLTDEETDALINSGIQLYYPGEPIARRNFMILYYAYKNGKGDDAQNE